MILGPISALMGQNTFVNTLIPAPQQFFAAGALRTFDTIIVQHNTTLIPAQAVPIIASLLNPRKKNFPRKEKINQAKRTLYLDVGLVKFAEEGYDMEMRGGRLLVRVANYGGLFQAAVTLSQWLSANQSPDGFLFPAEFKIVDRPKFDWRGMHLDVSRHFFPVSFIKKYIDILSGYKINRFHWHLTDDQGWRIEIKKYPRLTQIGGVRAETMTAKNFDPYIGDGLVHSGLLHARRNSRCDTICSLEKY